MFAPLSAENVLQGFAMGLAIVKVLNMPSSLQNNGKVTTGHRSSVTPPFLFRWDSDISVAACGNQARVTRCSRLMRVWKALSTVCQVAKSSHSEQRYLHQGVQGLYMCTARSLLRTKSLLSKWNHTYYWVATGYRERIQRVEGEATETTGVRKLRYCC